VKVATSPDFLESVANDPRVHRFVSLGEPVSFGGQWGDCIGLEWDTGGFVFHRRDPDTYEVHTLFLPHTPDTNGKAQQALGYMFNTIGAQTLLTQVAKDLPHVRRFAKRHGFRKFAEGPWGEVGADYFILTREEWHGCPLQQSPQS
jgi:hypothetical protein